MDRPTAIKAVDWAERLLFTNQRLSKEQRELWVELAEEYTSEDWTTGIKAYFKGRERDFPPPLGIVRQYMPNATPDEKRGTPFPADWEEKGGEYSPENYEAYLKAKEKEGV